MVGGSIGPSEVGPLFMAWLMELRRGLSVLSELMGLRMTRLRERATGGFPSDGALRRRAI